MEKESLKLAKLMPSAETSLNSHSGVRKPSWLKVRVPGGPNYIRLKGLLRKLELHTVCEEAHCPNIGECFEDRTATFLILGEVCTRDCGFCAIRHGEPRGVDEGEADRVAEAVQELNLQHAVITSVTRDDLEDGGASVKRIAELIWIPPLYRSFSSVSHRSARSSISVVR